MRLAHALYNDFKHLFRMCDARLGLSTAYRDTVNIRETTKERYVRSYLVGGVDEGLGFASS